MKQDNSLLEAQRKVAEILRDDGLGRYKPIQVPSWIKGDTRKKRQLLLRTTWNGFVAELQRGRYSDLIHIKKRLKNHKKKVKRSREKVTYFELALSLVKVQAERYGPDGDVLETLHDGLEGWSVSDDGENLIFEVPDAHLTPRSLKRPKPKERGYLSLAPSGARSIMPTGAPWGAAVESIEMDVWGTRAALEKEERRYEIARFRLSVLKNVLNQHRLFGHVAKWEKLFRGDRDSFFDEVAHDRTIIIGEALRDYYEKHKCFPENAFNGKNDLFLVWAGKKIDRSVSIARSALVATECWVTGQQGKKGQHLDSILEKVMAYPQRHGQKKSENA